VCIIGVEGITIEMPENNIKIINNDELTIRFGLFLEIPIYPLILFSGIIEGHSVII
jgi:hypothetical protein